MRTSDFMVGSEGGDYILCSVSTWRVLHHKNAAGKRHLSCMTRGCVTSYTSESMLHTRAARLYFFWFVQVKVADGQLRNAGSSQSVEIR